MGSVGVIEESTNCTTMSMIEVLFTLDSQGVEGSINDQHYRDVLCVDVRQGMDMMPK